MGKTVLAKIFGSIKSSHKGHEMSAYIVPLTDFTLLIYVYNIFFNQDWESKMLIFGKYVSFKMEQNIHVLFLHGCILIKMYVLHLLKKIYEIMNELNECQKVN